MQVLASQLFELLECDSEVFEEKFLVLGVEVNVHLECFVLDEHQVRGQHHQLARWV